MRYTGFIVNSEHYVLIEHETNFRIRNMKVLEISNQDDIKTNDLMMFDLKDGQLYIVATYQAKDSDENDLSIIRYFLAGGNLQTLINQAVIEIELSKWYS
jgi:hypothetical protein